ncbi:hypothetical protein BC830DRAFT_1077440 [Chytriomyces sp. MP71]|nr:hypothetical protein BC830DRAFT_1077440 [Chytriomyces sp. MP71]
MLSAFLVRARTALQRSGTGNVLGVQMVVGNEAADLDSVVSAIAFSVFVHRRNGAQEEPRVAPVIAIPRNEFALRTDIKHALNVCFGENEAANITDSLLFLDSPLVPSTAEAFLTDHNVPAPSLTTRIETISVVGIVDHHADERCFLNASPRLIEPCGSASSLVAHLFETESIPIDSSLAQLLLAPILLDTVNLNQDFNRVTQRDRDAVAFLTRILDQAGDKPPLNCDAYFAALQAAKFDTSSLSAMDLLRKDYKQTACKSASSGRTIQMGISSVGTSVQDLVAKDDAKPLVGVLRAFLLEKGLDFLLVMTSYEDAQDSGHFKREMLCLFGSKEDARIASAGIERNKDMLVFEAGPVDGVIGATSSQSSMGEVVKWYRIGNVKMSRKLVQPILIPLVESM